MPRRLIVATAVAAGMSAALFGCTGAPARTATSSPPPVTMAGARHCHVTLGHPVPATKSWRHLLFGWPSAYGNRSLWVGSLWPHGVVIIAPDDIDPNGRLEMKFGWYRLTSGILMISGRRLDAPAPALSAWIPEYGLTGFNSSAVIFPTEGCWQVTGRAGKAALTFVTFVIKGR